MVYAGTLAHGTALSAAETVRMIPQLSTPAVRQAMRWAADELRLAEACSAVLTFMPQAPDRRLLGAFGPRILRHDEPGDGQARVAGTARSA